MNPDRSQISVIHTQEELDKFLLDDTIRIMDIIETAPRTLLLIFKPLLEFVKASPNVNVVYGIYTTAYARIKLYSEMVCKNESTKPKTLFQ